MQFDTVDVLVVGAGPAAYISALFGTEVGATVTMAAPEPLPLKTANQRIETVMGATLRLAEQLGLADCFVAARLSSIGMLLRDGQVEPSADYNESDGWHIDRLRLDENLRARIVAAGICIEPAKVVQLTQTADCILCKLSNGKIFRCNLLIDATGRTRSSMPSQRKLLSPPLLALTGLIEGRQDVVGQNETRFESREWGWLWSTSDCDGYYGWTAMVDATQPCPEPVLAMKQSSRPESISQSVTTWQVNLLRHPRVLPVGDAAGALDPASGLGLANVIETACLVTGVVSSVVKDPACVADVARLFHSRRISLLLKQADQLSNLYDANGILQRGTIFTNAAAQTTLTVS